MSHLVSTVDDLLGMPPSARQYLSIVDSEVEAEEVRRAETPFLARFASAAMQVAMDAAVEAAKVSLSLPFSGPATLIKKIVSEQRKPSAQSTSPLALVSPDVARAMELVAPKKTVFARHPLVEKRYLPMARFHDDIFQDRVLELEKLLAYLGAKSVSVEAEEESKWSGQGEATLTVGKDKYGASASAKKHGGRFASLNTSYPNTLREPVIPDGLVWYGVEPMWRQMAELRISHGRLDYALDLKSTDDFGVTADVAAAFEGCKLSVGGKFNDFQSRQLRINVEFWPLGQAERR